MAFLDEIAAILEGSTLPLYPVSSGSYWVAQDTIDQGIYFQEAEAGLVSHTTSAAPVGVLGHSSGSYLVAFGSIAAGWPVYRGHMPDSTAIGDRAIALVNTPGEPEWERVAIEPRGLQVVVRGAGVNQTATGYEEAMDEAVRVRDALHEYVGMDPTGATHYLGIWNENGPFFGGFDQSLRPAFPMNFRALRNRTT